MSLIRADHARGSERRGRDIQPAFRWSAVLSQVLHDWDDERCTNILRRCRRVVAENGHVAIAGGGRVVDQDAAATALSTGRRWSRSCSGSSDIGK